MEKAEGAVAVYCAEPRLLARVRLALGAERPVVVTESWQAFERQAARSACMVVVVEWLRSAELVERLERVRGLAGQGALVVVTAKDADGVRELSRVRVEEIVWPHEVERGLAGAVERALGETPLERIGRELERVPVFPPRLRRALLAALRSMQPVVTVEQAAAAAGCDRRTLWRELRSLEVPGVRLQDVLDWILLVRLGMLRGAGRKWSGIAAEVGIHEHTLGRIVRRLTGQTQRGFGAAGTGAVLREFEEGVFRTLVTAAGRAGGDAETAAGEAEA